MTTQPEQVAYDMHMTRMVEEIELEELKEADRRYSKVLYDEDVFYTPGDFKYSVIEETKFKEVEKKGSALVEQEKDALM